MRRALGLAQSHRPHPNPRVGSVVVSATGVVLGEGAHKGPGESHAEVVALRQAGTASRGSTLYVTLEPCAHQGRTPPCVDAIVAAGVARVVIGARDPDGRVAGEGIARLLEAGIEVTQSPMEGEARAVDPAYFHHRETGMPLVTLKYAMTLDGSVAARDRSSQWITSERARADAHRLRAAADAVVIGAGTLRVDDPQLDVRLVDHDDPQPRPVVIAGLAALPSDARLWDRDPIVVSTGEVDAPVSETVQVGPDGQGLPEPREAARALAERGYLDLLLEGGPKLAGAWWSAGIVDKGVVYIGGKVGGGWGIPPLAGMFETMDDAQAAEIIGAHNLGSDIRVDFERVRHR